MSFACDSGAGNGWEAANHGGPQDVVSESDSERREDHETTVDEANMSRVVLKHVAQPPTSLAAALDHHFDPLRFPCDKPWVWEVI